MAASGATNVPRVASGQWLSWLATALAASLTRALTVAAMIQQRSNVDETDAPGHHAVTPGLFHKAVCQWTVDGPGSEDTVQDGSATGIMSSPWWRHDHDYCQWAQN